MCVRMRECVVCVSERDSVFVCVCVFGREIESVCVRGCVCVYE